MTTVKGTEEDLSEDYLLSHSGGGSGLAVTPQANRRRRDHRDAGTPRSAGTLGRRDAGTPGPALLLLINNNRRLNTRLFTMFVFVLV